MSHAPSLSYQSLRDFSYFRTGGECLGVFSPRNILELRDGLHWMASQKAQYFILGHGSNSLLSDAPYPGYIISMHNMNSISRDKHHIICDAGALNANVVQFALEQKLSGIEWMCGLPGQIGGTTRMNARCYGGEISQVVSQVTCLSFTNHGEDAQDTKQDLEIRHYYKNQHRIFAGYKDTIFMRNRDILCSVVLDLTPTEHTHHMLTTMQKYHSDRKQKGQFLHPSCGCIFKNNHSSAVGIPSGMLLELSGAKTIQRHKAEVSPYHANFIFNKGASSESIVDLSYAMRESVYNTFGVWMDYEMEFLGEFSKHSEQQIKEKRSQDKTTAKSNRLQLAREDFQSKKTKSTK